MNNRNLMSMGTLAVCVAVVCGFAHPEQPAAKAHPHQETISLTLHPQQGDQFPFGEASPAVFTLKNLSDRALVVLGLESQIHRSAEPIVLYGDAYGQIHQQPDEDAYMYDSMAQMATRPWFYSAFLLPAQQVQVHCRYRATSTNDRFAVRYFAAAGQYDGTRASLSPINAYITTDEGDAPWRDAVYRPFEHEAWAAIAQQLSYTSQIGPGVPPRAVIIPAALAAADKAVLEVDVPVSGDAFTADAARRTASAITGTHPEEIVITHSNALGGYIVHETDHSWFLHRAAQKSKGRILPALPPGMLTDLDDAGSVRVRVGEKQQGLGPERRDAGWKFWGEYPVIYGDGMYTRGEFIEISPGNLRSFLEDVRGRDGHLTEHRYFFKSRYFQLHLPRAE